MKEIVCMFYDNKGKKEQNADSALLSGLTRRQLKELEEKEFTAKAGGGMVTAVVNGNREVTKIEIKPEAVDPDDVEMLEDLVLAAVNEALRQYEAASDATVNKIAGGMKLGF